ncbi:Non-ribosomal peptide synthetase component F [Actinacidiphila yanglinensis]|uniref:Non-ribosomal peptide synthetase component F n=1 Tax=Actinacidiphila yanglinensis TaxID=310779 RepID=A0A1H6DG81_9ACTN|nr:condensation domain-containing protein [Actinacidiphila yanglinensis]SEG84368.1 Non-ribosomal peptide synthetase component F [Actinacidiphila yanglinensis]
MRPATLTAEQRKLFDRLVDRLGGAGTVDRITRVPGDRSCLPLSSSQQRIWFFDQLQPEAAIYNVAGAARIRGKLDAELLRRCLGAIVERHEILRTTYHQVDGAGVQRVGPATEPSLPLVDLSVLPVQEREGAAAEYCAAEARRPFDLTRDPMLRPTLLRLSAEEHLLLLCQHHIATDGWSVNLLMREIGERYAAHLRGEKPQLPDLPVQYGDYAEWQRGWLDGARMRDQLDYWRERLADSRLVDLATGRPRPTVLSWDGGTLRRHIPADVIRRVTEVAESEQSTLYMALVAAQSVVLSRWSGQSDVVVGCPVANRGRAEVEHLVGCFINEVPLRVDTSGNPTFRQLLCQVREVALGAYDNQEVPFERVVEAVNPERDAIAHAPLVRHQLGLHNEPQWRVELPGLTFEVAGLSTDTARFDLEVDLSPDGAGGLSGTVYYSTDLFTEDIVLRLLDSLDSVLDAAGRQPDRIVAELPLVGRAESDRLRDVGSGAPAPGGTAAPESPKAPAGFLGLMDRARTAAPSVTAVSGPDATLSHQELDRLANRLSWRLQALGVRPGQPVAVCLPPSARLVTALLAVAKAGGAAVPLNPDYPVTELNEALLDCSAGLVLTDGDGPKGLDSMVRPVDPGDPRETEGLPEDRPAWTVPAEGPAFVCYPRPEPAAVGTVNSHAAVARRLAWAATCFPLTAGDAVLVALSAFDLAPWELLGVPAARGRLVLPEDGSPAGIALAVRRETVRTLRCTASTLAGVLAALAEDDRGPAPLRHVVISGEAAWPALVGDLARVAPGARLFQQSGPASAALDTLAQPVAATHRPGSRSLLGTLLPGPGVRVLDRCGAAVPMGVPGELCLTVPPTPPVFLGRPRESADALVEDPLGVCGQLLRTGSRARWLPDGRLDLLAEETRVRRHLLETRDIAAALEELPDVARANAATLAQDLSAAETEPLLVAHVSLRPDPSTPRTKGTGGTAVSADRGRKLFEEIWTSRSAEDDPTLNPEGWNSPQTGEYLTAAEMREWADSSLRRITALRPARVLEIGCKTGALLFRLAPRCDTYTGTDLSTRALAHIRSHQDWLANKVDDVTLLPRAADDFTDFEDARFDTVVINSVVQYFPDQSYLERVLRGALALLPPGGHVYLGAVRSLPLLRALHLPAQLARLEPGARAAELRDSVASHVAREEELALDPGYFTGLAGRLPGLAEVYVLPRLGRSRNELAGYRYDVVLRAGSPIAAAPPVTTLDWQADGLDPAALTELLRAGGHSRVLLRGVPDARLRARLDALRALDADTLRSAAEVTAALVPQPARAGGPIDPHQLNGIAAEAGHRAMLQYRDDGPGDELDVLLTREEPGDDTGAGAEQHFPTGFGRRPAAPGSTPRPLANQPLTAARSRTVAPLLRAHLQERFPGYAVPAHLLVVDAFPTGRDLTLDRAALPRPDLLAAAAEAQREPGTDTEKSLARIWAEALGVDRIGVHDDFFALGGHSLLGAEVIERVRKDYKIDVPLGRLFESPTIASVAAFVDERLSRPQEEIAPIRRQSREALRRRRAERAAASGRPTEAAGPRQGHRERTP